LRLRGLIGCTGLSGVSDRLGGFIHLALGALAGRLAFRDGEELLYEGKRKAPASQTGASRARGVKRSDHPDFDW
jgi:hypothetical protein